MWCRFAIGSSRERDVAAGREPVELHGEDDDQHQAEPEMRVARARPAQPSWRRSPSALPRRTAAITPAGIPIRMPIRIDEAGQLERDRDPRHDRVRDGELPRVGAEVSLQRAARPTWRTAPAPARRARTCAGSPRAPRDRAILARRARAPDRRAAPGRRAKTTTLARKRTIRAAPALRRRKPPISSLSCLVLLAEEAGEVGADQPVGVHLHAVHPASTRRRAGRGARGRSAAAGGGRSASRRSTASPGLLGRRLAGIVEDEVELRVEKPASLSVPFVWTKP